MLVGCYSHGTMTNLFYLFIHVSSNLIFLYYYFLSMTQLPNFFLSTQKHALDFISLPIMSNSITLPQELYFLNNYHILFFPSPSLLSLSYTRLSLSSGLRNSLLTFLPISSLASFRPLSML